MAVLVPNLHGQNIHSHLTRSLEKILDEAHQSGELKLSNRKLKDFPKAKDKYNLSDTVIADLSKNRFNELPEEVTDFHFLERLHCYHNSIRHIPDTISSLQCLNFLDLSRNQLTTLPREICLLPIQILLVSNNRLSCLPDDLYKMSHLTELDASCNQITHFPPRMGELRSLQSLVLRSNLLLAVPVEITFLKLMRLDLSANRINTLPIEMREMDSIIDLIIDENPLMSPPASLCKRGRVHIFKYLEIEAMKIASKTGGNTGTLGRRSRKGGAGSPGPSHLATRLKHKRQNVDSGYSTSSDCYEKRWSQELGGDEKSSWPSTPILGRNIDHIKSTTSTPSTISPATVEDDFSKNGDHLDKPDGQLNGTSARLSPCGDLIINGNSNDDTPKIQTYREYKEALKQQRLHDVPSIYRTKDPDDQSHTKTEPNTPTHHPQNQLATSKSDPTPLNSAFGNPRSIFDDTGGALNATKKPVQKVQPSRNTNFSSPQHTATTTNTSGGYSNGTKLGGGGGVYVKPSSPLKGAGGGCLGHDSVPASTGAAVQAVILNGKTNNSSTLPKLSMPNYVNGTTSTPKSTNGIKSQKNPGWNKEGGEKMTFTMRREIDKAREETDLINQLRTIIETRLKMALPEDLASALTDGVVLCHLANHIKPRSVASIHVPSPAVPKLTMARCRRNVDNFIDACRKIGVDETLVCCAADVLEGKGLVQVAVTVMELLRFHSPRSPLHSHNLSTVV
ncbi:leucine-rich repeat and calponin homology domain-containing protein isoform X2 [Anthonomus grandis grandis]|uniref:leucine-rich repeat and calponin homology domain-containing protein isoform X2 n=1 Tax=Anthonomus grandis grandis TaxID=2921223 RepID=UPI002165B5D1|nr:leucine-rich repeat and calponin homology domain-containing protein isoform X2 [Anthonomus grandis grandis]